MCALCGPPRGEEGHCRVQLKQVEETWPAPALLGVQMLTSPSPSGSPSSTNSGSRKAACEWREEWGRGSLRHLPELIWLDGDEAGDDDSSNCICSTRPADRIWLCRLTSCSSFCSAAFSDSSWIV